MSFCSHCAGSSGVPTSRSIQMGEVGMSRYPEAIKLNDPIDVVVTFVVPFRHPPQVCVMMSGVDADDNDNVRVVVDVAAVTASNLTLRASSWAGSKTWSVWVTWIARCHPSVHGSMMPDLPSMGTVGLGPCKLNCPSETSVTFDRPFGASPTVLVGLRGLDCLRTANTRIRLDVVDSNQSGFRVRASAWADTQIYAAPTSWIALPPSRWFAGGFSPSLGGIKLDHDKREAIPVPEHWEAKCGISTLDREYLVGLRVRTSVDAHEGFVAKSWCTSLVHCVGVAWMALPASALQAATDISLVNS